MKCETCGFDDCTFSPSVEFCPRCKSMIRKFLEKLLKNPNISELNKMGIEYAKEQLEEGK